MSRKQGGELGLASLIEYYHDVQKPSDGKKRATLSESLARFYWSESKQR